MNRFILLVLAAHCLPASVVAAENYLVRLDAVGYVDRPVAERDPEETLLHSIEVIARPDAAFHGRVKVGKETLTLTGELCPGENGAFNLKVRYAHSIDKGGTILAQDGTRKPRPERTTTETSATLAVGGSAILGGNGTKSGQLKSKTRYLLFLAKDEPQHD